MIRHATWKTDENVHLRRTFGTARYSQSYTQRNMRVNPQVLEQTSYPKCKEGFTSPFIFIMGTNFPMQSSLACSVSKLEFNGVVWRAISQPAIMMADRKREIVTTLDSNDILMLFNLQVTHKDCNTGYHY